MKKTLVILGNSQLSFFVAKQLGSSLGDLAHLDIIWLTNTEKIYPAADKPFLIKAKLKNILVKLTTVKSINLSDRRVITTGKTYNYDLLFIDQTPVFSAKEYQKITDQFETLISAMRSKENRGIAVKAKISLDGKSFSLNQLALNFSDRRSKDSSAAVSSLRIEATPETGKMTEFFKENNIFSRKSQYPGISIKPPLSIFPNKKIRGLGVDMAGYAMLLATGEPANHQNTVMIDSDDRVVQNIARSDWHLAKQISDNLVVKLEGGLEKPIDHLGDKLLLHSSRGYFVKLGDMVSSRNKAKIIYALDRRFWSKLLS